MGGTVAYEMAQQLHRQGEKVSNLLFLETYNIDVLPESGPYLRLIHLIAQRLSITRTPDVKYSAAAVSIPIIKFPQIQSRTLQSSLEEKIFITVL